MINFLLGAPGSGKSYEAVAFHIIPSLDQGRAVVTNMPLNVEEIKKIIPNASQLIFLIEPTASNSRPFSTVNDYQNDWKDLETGQGALYVIDECHMALPRGSTSRAVEEWYAMHRHTGADVLLITQSYRKVSQTICDLIQTVYRVRKNIALGSSSSYVRKVQDGVRGEVVNTSIRRYNPAYFKYYKSHTLTNSSVNEAQAKDIKSIWSHWSIKGLIVLALFAAWFASTHEFSLFPNLDKPVKVVAPKPVSPPVSAPVPASPPLPDITPSPSSPSLVNSSIKPQNQIATTSIHPYAALTLHILGVVSNENKRVYHLMAAFNAQPSFSLTSDDLLSAGYTFEPLNDCVIFLHYADYHTYLTCDSPKVNVNSANASRPVAPTVSSSDVSSVSVVSSPAPVYTSDIQSLKYGQVYSPPVQALGYDSPAQVAQGDGLRR